MPEMIAEGSKRSEGPGKPVPKKKKKNAPDRPQPAWLFPPDEENPALNPKPKSQEQIDKDTAERLEAISFLKHKSVTAPMKPPPPSLLMQMVGAFLTEYGFNSASRIFTVERSARVVLDDWKDEIRKNQLRKGMPNLVKIFKSWHEQWEIDHAEDTSGSSSEGSGDEEGSSEIPKKNSYDGGKSKINDASTVKGHTSFSSTSSSISSSDSDSEGEGKGGPSRRPQQSSLKKSRNSSSPDSSRSSTSDTDADDESDIIATQHLSSKPTVQSLVNGLKRKHTSVGADAGLAPSSKKLKVDVSKPPKDEKKKEIAMENKNLPNGTAKENEEMNSKNASMHSTETKADATSKKRASLVDEKKKKKQRKDKVAADGTQSEPKRKVDASAKVNVEAVEKDVNGTALEAVKSDAAKPETKTTKHKTTPITASGSSSSLSSSSASDNEAPIQIEPGITSSEVVSRLVDAKRKLEESGTAAPEKAIKKLKSSIERFSRIPADTKVDPKLASNAYISYDYADQAHKDLIKTKGKGFTKEKNKKKRGSYRGGAIDTSGGRAVKFED